MPETSAFALRTSDFPPCTCLCPTYGRFERLRDAVACFLLQDYPGEKHLLVLNDAPEPIRREGARAPVTVCNVQPRYATLGDKRQALLEIADTPLVAHWDDDDLYLPWHLSRCVERLLETDSGCARPRAAWWAVGPPAAFRVKGPKHNVFEGQMVFRRERALELGGYPPKHSGQAKDLLRAFGKVGELETWNPGDADISYVYRWGDGLCHISGAGNTERAAETFGTVNSDFGAGDPLIPSDEALPWARRRIGGQFARLAAQVERGGGGATKRRDAFGA